MALRLRPSDALERGLRFLQGIQNLSGSWPAFNGDDHDGCWVTALAVMTLITCGQVTQAIERGLRWLLTSKGRESHWLWRWKFRTSDTHVQFNPDKFGWPWMPETCSWVVPTSFAVLALKQSFVCCQSSEVSFRVTRAVEMLLDRVCPNGGWNAGNGVVYGVPLAPHIDATAAALLAMRGETQCDAVVKSLDWLERRAQTCSAGWSLAWSVLALNAHGRSTASLLPRLAALLDRSQIEDSATLAVVILALDCSIQGNVFRVTV
jgi:squalene cyclase